MSDEVVVFGASGHAKVVIDVLEKEGKLRIKGIVDDNKSLHGKIVLGYPVLGGTDHIPDIKCDNYIVAIGNNAIRQKVLSSLKGKEFVSAIHPTAVLAKGVRIGKGSVVMAGAIINSDATIGDHVVVNTAATVDHDCVVEDVVHIGPGCHLCGNVTLKKGVFLGGGITLIPGVTVGQNAYIGAGSIVVTDIDESIKVVGNPAKRRLG